MAWQDLKYSTKGAVIGGLIGLVEFFLFGVMSSIILKIIETVGIIIGVCSWKTGCQIFISSIFGIILNIIIFSLIGFIIGKIKSKKTN